MQLPPSEFKPPIKRPGRGWQGVPIEQFGPADILQTSRDTGGSTAAEIAFQPTSIPGGGVVLTELNTRDSSNLKPLAGSLAAKSLSTVSNAPFATTEASFLSAQNAPADEGNAEGIARGEGPFGGTPSSDMIRLQMDMPFPLNILHPEVATPNYVNCTSHSDAMATSQCNTWCGLNPEECTNGFVALAEDVCQRRRPDMPVCTCLRELQQQIYTNGGIPLSIVPTPILNATLTKAILNGPSINQRCGPLDVTLAKQGKIQGAEDAAKAQLIAAHPHLDLDLKIKKKQQPNPPLNPPKEKFFFQTNFCANPPSLWLHGGIVLLLIYWIANRHW